MDGAAGATDGGLSYQIDITARTVFGEARGESANGKIAVAWVIRNRAEMRLRDGKSMWWGNTPADVCMKRWQFSCWNDDDPNRDIIQAATLDQPHFAECFGIAALVLTGQLLPDPTGGATHYHSVSIADPSWAPLMSMTRQIGNHRFFK